MKTIFIGLLCSIGFLINHNLYAQTNHSIMHHTSQDSVYVWEGQLLLLSKNKKEEVSVLLKYQAYDSIPGRYHKQLIVGRIKSLKTDEEHFLLGYVQNQTDISYHFYGIAADGRVERTILTGANDYKMEGYLMKPGEDEMKGAFSLVKKDSVLLTQSIEATPDKIFGEYAYNFGPGQPEGHLSVHKNADGTINFRLSSIDKGGSGDVAIYKDSLKISGTSFVFDAQVQGVSIYQIQVRFYKGFAVTAFVKPNYESDRFGKRATIEGFFRKIE